MGAFAWVAGLAVIVDCLLVALTAIAYAGDGGLRLAQLGGVTVAVLGAHLIATLVTRRRRRPDRGTWAIAGAQLVGALVATLLVADLWILELFLLGIIPLQIAVADRPRRIPLAIIVALLGVAGMVAVDLFDPPGRLTVFADRPDLMLVPGSVLAAHVAALAIVLWQLRLRRSAPLHLRLDLATLLPLVLTGISVASILVVTGVLVSQIRASQIDQVQRNFQTLADIHAERVGNALDGQVEGLLTFGRRATVLQDALTAANEGYPDGRAERAALLEQREQEWQTSPATSDFVLRYRNNPAAFELSRFRGEDLLHSDIILTDAEGGLVAAQGEKPERFSYADTAWWQAAWNDSVGGVYLGDLTIHPEAGTAPECSAGTCSASVFIAVPVLNPQTNGIAGVLASNYDLAGVQRDIGLANDQLDAAVLLLSPDGSLIAGPSGQDIGVPATDALSAAIGGAPGQGSGNARAPVVEAHSPITATAVVNRGALQALGLVISVADSEADALAEVTRSTEVATLVGLLAIALGVIAATAAARPITRPIEALTSTAAAIAAGDLDQRASTDGPAELSTLAEAFNTLTARLRTLISGLQHQVALRTGQLEARVEQLATLNRITQTVSSMRDLETAPPAVTQEIVELFDAQFSGITLSGGGGGVLELVAEHARGGTADPTASLIVPIAQNPSSAAVVASGRSLVLEHAQTNPLTGPLHDALRARGTRCLMIVPLLSRGAVIGTLVVATDQADRVFTSNEVALAETVAGQIASAVENSRLFEEMQRAKEAAVAANDAKSAFLANVSHELRTPLTSVVGFAKMIRKRLDERVFPLVPQDDPRAQRAVDQVRSNVEIIVAEGDRLTTLINNVLDLAKIEAGKVDWVMEPLQVDTIVDRGVAATTALFEEKGLELTQDVEEGLPTVIGDRDSLIQVVINLLSNAVKFTDQGSVSCRAQLVGSDIVVSVSDTGMGIAEADQPRVFEQFAQVGDTLTGKPLGTGLGLPICKQIVERHGGRLWVESVVGSGSTFSFTLPTRSSVATGNGSGSTTPGTVEAGQAP
jgi:signal transduction histidine kinase/HAMP domain-containing protein